MGGQIIEKIIDLPGGQINDPSSGKHYSLPFRPATPLSRSLTLDSPRNLLSQLQIYKDQVRCAQDILKNANLGCAFAKNALL